MDLKFEVFGALCAMSLFRINGIDADEDDFGGKWDHDPENAEDYGCGNMQFERKESTPAVMDKYKITQGEYEIICEKLEDSLSFGSCGWCV